MADTSEGYASAVRILVAEGDPVLGGIVRDGLLKSGYDVQLVDNGEDAIAQVRTTEFGIGILDVRLPGVNGFGVLNFIKREKPVMRVIMVSAYSNLKNSVMSHEAGADDFLAKPFDLETLRSTIEALLPR